MPSLRAARVALVVATLVAGGMFACCGGAVSEQVDAGPKVVPVPTCTAAGCSAQVKFSLSVRLAEVEGMSFEVCAPRVACERVRLAAGPGGGYFCSDRVQCGVVAHRDGSAWIELVLEGPIQGSPDAAVPWSEHDVYSAKAFHAADPEPFAEAGGPAAWSFTQTNTGCGPICANAGYSFERKDAIDASGPEAGTDDAGDASLTD
jgi:hypothetical protein